MIRHYFTFLLALLPAVLFGQLVEKTPIVPAQAEIDIVERGDQVEAHVYLAIEPNEDGSIYEIGDWGQPRYDGQVIYLEAQSSGPVKSLNRQPIKHFHAYNLFDESDHEIDPDDLASIVFRNLELIPEWLRPQEAQNLVFHSADEWNAWVSKNWPPHIRAPQPGPPVNFDKEMVIAVFLGEVDQGFSAQIENLSTDGKQITATYSVVIPGILPEIPEKIRPGHMVAMAQSRLPVRFSEDVIALPSAPPGEPLPVDPLPFIPAPPLPDPIPVDPLPTKPFPIEPAGPLPIDLGQLPIAAHEGSEDYAIVFSIDGHTYAKAVYHVEVAPFPLPMEASIAVTNEGDDQVAHVKVAITGSPYQTIADWGTPVLTGNTFVIEARSQEIVFIREPDLPIIETNDYLLSFVAKEGDEPTPAPIPLPDPIEGEPIDFTRLEPVRGKERQLNVVVNTLEEWWKLIGFEPGPLVLPAPTPVDLEKNTIIGTFAGAKPNGCYGISIDEVVVQDGVVLVYYTTKVPGPDELCTQAITYPASLVAIEKTTMPIDFIERTSTHGPVIIESEPGIGHGARGPEYQVLFRVNGQDLARTSFRLNDVVLPPKPLSLIESIKGRLHADVEDASSASVHVAIDLSGWDVPLKVFDWGIVKRDGPHLLTNLTINEPGDEEGGAFLAEHTYELSDLTEEDSYKFTVWVNGEELTATKFSMRRNDGIVDPDPVDGQPVDVDPVDGSGGDNDGGEKPPTDGLPGGPEVFEDAFTSWLSHFLPGENDANGGAAAFPNANRFNKTNNFDGDAWSDFEEFLLGLNPADPKELPFIRPEWIKDEQGRGHLALCFKRHQKASEFADFVIEASKDLSEWIEDPSLLEQIDAKPLDANTEEVTVRLRDLIEASSYRYLRLRLREKQ